jgi:hypothetical protein
MLDLSHIPNSQQDIKIYYANQGNFGYQTWQKPRKCNFVYIMYIDGGGGGSSGVSAVLNTTVGGNVGGGSGGVTRAMINANLVPDTLYIKVGKGGTGGSSATGANGTYNAGTTGESSGVFVLSQLSSQANTAQAVSLLGGAIANNGGNGATVAPGTPASSLANNYLIGLTNFISTKGVDSAAFDLTPLTSQIVMGGGQGAFYNGTTTAFNGSSILSSSISPLIPGGIGGSTLGGNGADGYTSFKPFFSTGGAGGGNATTAGGVAGNGGNGGIGSGGGAGGNANAGTGGRGGDGGDGLVVIISF